jgi:hypothetical protein
MRRAGQGGTERTAGGLCVAVLCQALLLLALPGSARAAVRRLRGVQGRALAVLQPDYGLYLHQGELLKQAKAVADANPSFMKVREPSAVPLTP